jgi:tetratricopeptide (TPR) repeat protein
VVADPRYLPVRRVLANRYRADNQPNEAVTQLKAIVEIEPERVENSFELGAYLWSIDRKGDAVAAYEACAQRHPDDQNALYYAAHVSLESGDHARGVQWAEKLLKLAPKHAPGNLDMAKLKLAVGLPKEAIKFARVAEEAYADQAGKDQAKQVQAQAEGVLKSGK